MELCRNYVELWGVAEAAPVFSHENHGQRFYKFPLRVDRLSGQADRPNVVVGENQLERMSVSAGESLRVVGQLRSFNNKSGQGSRLIITVLAQELERGDGGYFNRILLSGVNKTFRYHFLHSSETVAEILYVVIGLVGIAAGLNFCKNFIFSPAAQLESTNLMNDAVGYHVMAGIACLLIMMLSLLSDDDDEQSGQPEEEAPAEESPAEEQPEAAADSAQEVTEESIPDAAPEEVPAEQEVTA